MSVKEMMVRESNVTTRVVPGHFARAWQQLANVMDAKDLRTMLSDSNIERVEQIQADLAELGQKVELRVAQVKIDKAEAAEKAKAERATKAKAKVVVEDAPEIDLGSLTKKELAARFVELTGTPAPSKWNKTTLVSKVTAAAA